MFFLDDPHEVWKGKLVALITVFRQQLPDCQLEMLTPVAGGYRIRPRNAESFESAFSKVVSAFGDVSLRRLSPPPRPVEVTLRGVDPGFSCPEILDDLRQSFGQDVRAVRRLHATTEGRVDQTRPLPVVVATVGEETASRLKGGVHLFGVLRVRTGPPRVKEQLAQCSRCFAWGHRATTCTSKKKCIRCGSVDHTSQSCSHPATARHCFACKGDHSVTYAGCRANADARRRLTNALTPRKVRPVTFAPAPLTDGRSFADVAKSKKDEATTGWTLVSHRRQPSRPDAPSLVLEMMGTEACADDTPEPNTSSSKTVPSPQAAMELPVPSRQSSDTTSPIPSVSRAQQDRKAKSRDLALKTRDIKKRVFEIEEERRNIPAARDSGLSSRRLSRRLRTINGHHKRLTQMLRGLEQERTSLSTSDRMAPSCQPPLHPSSTAKRDEETEPVGARRPRSRSRASRPPVSPACPQTNDLTAMIVDAMGQMRVVIQNSIDAAATMKAVDSLLVTSLAFTARWQPAHSV